MMLSQDPSRADSYKEVMKMEWHCVERRDTPIWHLLENCVVKPLIVAKVITEEDSTMIQRYCGIMDVNAFEARGETFEVCSSCGQYLNKKTNANHMTVRFLTLGNAHSWTLP